MHRMSAAIIETPRAAIGSAPVRPAPAYTITARVLHWITAAAILLMLPLGWASANEWGGAGQDWFYDLHRSIGAALIPLVLVRVVYRITHPPLPLPDAIAPLQRLAAAGTHWALYALLLAQPLIGWIATSARLSPPPTGRCRTGCSRGMRAAALPLRGSWRCMWQPRAITISSARTACSCACSRADRKYRAISCLAPICNQ
jgi:Prokaryotic cytochrome b561